MRRRTRLSALRTPTGAAAAAILLAMLGLLPGCGSKADAPGTPGEVRVVVSIPPLVGLVEALLPPGARVRVLVAPGQSPHAYEPTPSDIAAVGRADLVVLVGMGIEAGLPASVRDGTRVLSMGVVLGIDPGDADEPAQGHAHRDDEPHDHNHDHNHDHIHDHVGADPHLWLDPVLVESFVPELAAAVRAAMERGGNDTAALEGVAERADVLLESIRAVDSAYRERLAAHRGAVVITQHAAWSRLTDRYGIKVASEIQVAETGPSAGHLAELVQTASGLGVRAVLTEPQLDRAVAERLAAQLGVPLGTLDPLGSGNWTAMMLGNLDVLTEVLDPERTEQPDR
ncbi:MAG: metal ABC transporter substrate-binding protein [Planctomycetota bacterium]|nr:metal ABC transporter substrate-binding protein [Planctomycetota bacterium]